MDSLPLLVEIELKLPVNSPKALHALAILPIKHIKHFKYC